MQSIRNQKSNVNSLLSTTDGQTERINQEVKVFLKHYINYRQDNWTKWLATAEFQYNDKKHTAIGHSPFYVNYRRHPWKGNLTVEIKIPSITNGHLLFVMGALIL